MAGDGTCLVRNRLRKAETLRRIAISCSDLGRSKCAYAPLKGDRRQRSCGCVQRLRHRSPCRLEDAQCNPAHDAAAVLQDGRTCTQIALASCPRPYPLLVLAAPRSSIASSVVSCLISIRPNVADWLLYHSIIKLVSQSCLEMSHRSCFRDAIQYTKPANHSSNNSLNGYSVDRCSIVHCGFCQVFSCSTY